MGYTGKRARVDGNHSKIVKELRMYPGVSVRSVATIKGFCDIIVGFRGVNYLYEIKDPSKPPSARKLTEDEQKFHDSWTGHVKVILTTDEILKDIGVIN